MERGAELNEARFWGTRGVNWGNAPTKCAYYLCYTDILKSLPSQFKRGDIDVILRIYRSSNRWHQDNIFQCCHIHNRL